MMVIAFAFCASFGVFVARYLKDFYWWFPLHIFVQGFGVLLSFSSFIIALLMTPRHFSTLHSWFGLCVLCFTALAPALGLAAHIVYDHSRRDPPIWPDKIHWWVGRLTLVLSYITIFLGLRQYGSNVGLRVTFWGLCGLYVIIYAVLDVYRWTNRGDPEHSTLLTPKTR